MFRRLLATALLMLGALTPMPGHAATTRQVEARNTEFIGWSVYAQAGDSIEWEVTSGTHQISSYYPVDSDPGTPGDQPYFNFAANTQPYQKLTYAGFPGGEIRYFCRLHASVNNGVCTGYMCGYITDSAPADLPGSPTIATPAQNAGSNNHEVVISGTSPPGARYVRVRQCVDAGQGLTCYLELAKVESSGSWSVTRDFVNGTYMIRASSVHAQGFESAPSATRTFTVFAADRTSPVIDLQSPKDPSQTAGDLTRDPTRTAAAPASVMNPIRISMRITDDVGVKQWDNGGVEVKIIDLIGGGQPRVLAYNSELKCNAPCNPWNAQYNATVSVVPGYYEIVVTATDNSTRTDGSEKSTVSRRIPIVF